VTVATLKFGKAIQAKEYIFGLDEELIKAWGESLAGLIIENRGTHYHYSANLFYVCADNSG
jgi:hypothetical protein